MSLTESEEYPTESEGYPTFTSSESERSSPGDRRRRRKKAANCNAGGGGSQEVVTVTRSREFWSRNMYQSCTGQLEYTQYSHNYTDYSHNYTDYSHNNTDYSHNYNDYSLKAKSREESYAVDNSASYFTRQVVNLPYNVTASTNNEGFICVNLNFNFILEIAPNKAIQLRNTLNGMSCSLSANGQRMALIHPQGRVLQYGYRAEVQCQDQFGTKNAKFYPAGVSFTSTSCASVYLLDRAGPRTTMEHFHDLYLSNITEELFRYEARPPPQRVEAACQRSVRDLMSTHCWQATTEAGPVFNMAIAQVTVTQHETGETVVLAQIGPNTSEIRISPRGGKVKFQNPYVMCTASQGSNSHIFLRFEKKRLHYNSFALKVKNYGHSAGFEKDGLIRIF